MNSVTMTTMPRRVAHLDMDAFYASVELLRYPELRGLPVVIGGRSAPAPAQGPQGKRVFQRLHTYVGRGVVTTSTYEARALGVFSAMGMMKAAQLAPQAFMLPADFAAYRHYSGLFKAAVATIAPHIEDRGIDEIYIDLTEVAGDSLTLARRLKQAVYDATGLTCSIGITPNKRLSKIASELNKPDGITVLEQADLQTRIWPLAVGKINGIGPRAQQRLANMGIQTIGQLAQAAPHHLQEQFGAGQARWLLDAAWGIDDRPVETSSEPKSISRETTFERDLHVRHDRELLSQVFSGLCERLANDLERKGYVAYSVGIKLRFDDFKTVTRDMTLTTSASTATAIRQAAGQCLRRVSFTRRLRLLGVKVSALQPRGAAGSGGLAEPVQLSLY
jgi:DNA polymerase-4